MRALLPEAPAGDVHAFLARHEAKELLRFVIVGSVDDGKSTLVGRLLFELGAVYDDQLEAVRKASKQVGVAVDFSLITDGLEAEREQGITIDVAYRYFTTAARKFIVADTPGHVQYTRNMVTGASTADVAVALVDARLGVLEQTRRHATLAALLGIPHLLVAVNKMDLVGWEQARFDAISAELRAFCAGLTLADVTCVPVSALYGDNVVQAGTHAPWYAGPTVLGFLETVPAGRSRDDADLRFPVQLVLRPNLEYRGFAGRIASGVVRRGDEVVVLPSGRVTRVAAIDTFDGERDEAFAPQSVTLRLADEVDCSRGDVIAHPGHSPRVARAFEAELVWLHEKALDLQRTYLLKHGTQTVRAQIDRVHDHLDLRTLSRGPAETLALNDIGRVTLTCHRPILFDAYTECRATGSFIVIDALTNATVGAGLVTGEGGVARDDASTRVTPEERRARLGQVGVTLWLVTHDEHRGMDVARRIERRLFDQGHLVAVVSRGDEPLANVAFACRQLADAGFVAIGVGADAAGAEAVRTGRVIEVMVAPEGDTGSEVDGVVAVLEKRGVLTAR